MNETQTEISLPVALLMLAAVVMGLLGLSHKETLQGNWSLFQSYSEVLRDYLLIYFGVVFVNVILIIHFFRRLIGLSKQGARLRAIKSQTKDKSFNFKRTLLLFSIGCCLGFVIESLYNSDFTPLVGKTGDEIKSLFFFLNFGFITWFIGSRIMELIRGIRDKYKKQSLPEYPQLKDGIVLGSINEESDEIPDWEKITQRGLNGSILITGSIGSGKTAGAMLPYLHQILRNFDRSSILALDPKRTFVEEAENMISSTRPDITIRRITLDGNETFNPVYVDEVLQRSKFIDIAEMVRASSINYSGGHNDSPFWDISAFNLIKNSIVFVAATKGYYTLKDIYEAMVMSGSIDVSEALEDVLNKGEDSDDDSYCFNQEEKFNIECSIKYFKEEYNNMDNKVKTSILATATSFLNQFQEYRASRIFCPKSEARTITSIDMIVDEGEILLFDIESPSLARSMGTILKLHYQQSILRRVTDKDRGKEIPSFLICDEYQDVVSSGAGVTFGDDDFLAKSRQSNSVSIVATQSLSSIYNAISSEKAAKELIQNFRTRICFHSADIETIKNMQDLIGQDEIERQSVSISEIAQRTERNLLIGGFDSKNANISESVNTSKHREYKLTGKEFTALNTFEAWAIVFNGTSSALKKLYMKPLFLKDPSTPHADVLEMISPKEEKTEIKKALKFATIAIISTLSLKASAFPNICDVLKQPSFRSCLNFQVSPSMCGYPPRPCARISYYVPQTFIETTVKAGFSHFSTLPGAAAQLGAVSKKPYGAVNDDDSQSFHGRTIAIPLAQIALSGLPCGGVRQEKMCFDGMSEHLKKHWSTGSADLMQPRFLAWKLSPKACLIKGAVSALGEPSSISPDSAMCSVNMDALTVFPPSSMPVCTAWGVMFPRYGTQIGGSEIIGSLSIASRIKSLSAEVFQSMPSGPDEKWSMISPNSSQCFREFENIASVETFRLGNNRGRVSGKSLGGNLFSTWKKVSCTRDWAEVPIVQAEITIIEQVCKGI